MAEDTEARALRRWAIEAACRCAPATGLSDAVLICQIADVLISYVLTGAPVVEQRPPGRLM